MVSIFATVAMLFAAGAANAVLTFSVTTFNITQANTDLSLAVNGDHVVLDISVFNSGGGVASLGAGVFNIDPGSLTLLNGESADSWFNDSLFFGVLPSGGIGNTAGVAGGTLGMGIPGVRQLGGGDIIAGGTAVRIFNGVSSDIPSPDGDGSFDIGADNIYTNAGGFHASVEFTVNGVGTFVDIGTDVAILGGHVDATGAQVGGSDVNVVGLQIGAVPEPGTALLMGLGLSGLSLAGRRR